MKITKFQTAMQIPNRKLLNDNIHPWSISPNDTQITTLNEKNPLTSERFQVNKIDSVTATQIDTTIGPYLR